MRAVLSHALVAMLAISAIQAAPALADPDRDFTEQELQQKIMGHTVHLIGGSSITYCMRSGKWSVAPKANLQGIVVRAGTPTTYGYSKAVVRGGAIDIDLINPPQHYNSERYVWSDLDGVRRVVLEDDRRTIALVTSITKANC